MVSQTRRKPRGGGEANPNSQDLKHPKEINQKPNGSCCTITSTKPPRVTASLRKPTRSMIPKPVRSPVQTKPLSQTPAQEPVPLPTKPKVKSPLVVPNGGRLRLKPRKDKVGSVEAVHVMIFVK